MQIGTFAFDHWESVQEQNLLNISPDQLLLWKGCLDASGGK